MAVQVGHIIIIFGCCDTVTYIDNICSPRETSKCAAPSLCRCLSTLPRTRGEAISNWPRNVLAKCLFRTPYLLVASFRWGDSRRCCLLHHTVSSRPLFLARRIHKVKNHIEAPTVPDPVAASRVSSSINCDGGEGTESRSFRPPPMKR